MTTGRTELASAIRSLRNGSWLTRDRLRAYAGIAIALYICLLIYQICLGLHASGAGRTQAGRDFSQIWAAGQSVLQGHPLAPYDPAAHVANMKRLFGQDAPLYVFVYPPFCLGVAALFAMIPYLVGALVEQGLMLVLYARSIRAILPRRLALLCALGAPSVMVNLGYGQIGTLTAGLAGLAAATIDRRPALAGTLFACMAYKPQLGLAIPVALLAGRHWTTIAAASGTAGLLGLVSTIVFGWHSWVVFAASLHTAGNLVFSRGAVEWFKLESVFAAVRLWGFRPAVAWMAQGVTAIAALTAVAVVWRGDGDMRLKMALLMVASLLCTPYCFEYDLVVLSPAIALVISHGFDRGFMPWQKSLLAAVAVIPLFESLAAEYLRLPIGTASLLGFAVLVVMRTARDNSQSPEQPDRSRFAGPVSIKPASWV